MRTDEYSFARALAYLAAPRSADAAQAAGVELAASRAISAGTSRGIAVPPDHLARSMNTGAASEGGALVGQSTTNFAGALRARAVTARAGATIISGARHELHIPTMEQGAATHWIDEGAAPSNSMPQVKAGKITPKTVSAAVPVSRRLMLEGAVDIAGVVASDLMAALAAEIDAAALGVSEDAAAPSGLRQAIVGSRMNFDVAEPTFEEVIALLLVIEEEGVPSPAFVIDPATARAMRLGDAEPAPHLRGERLADRPALVTSAMRAGEVIVGGFADLVIAQFGGVDLRMDPLPGAAADTRVIRAFADVGFMVRRTSSFAMGGPAE